MNKTIITLNVGKINTDTKTIADKKYYTITGAYQQKKDGPTTWYDVLLRADNHEKFMSDVMPKVRSILVEGRIAASAYTNKEGKAVPSLSIWANDIEVMAWKNNEDTQKAAPSQSNDNGSDLPF